MLAEVIQATAHDCERLPETFHAASSAPHVAVLLPSPNYVSLIRAQQLRSFTYHLLTHAEYSMLSPIAFDADAFVVEVIEYAQRIGVVGCIAFDCFPTMLASIVNEELKLPGPSFRSCFVCINKYYMRRELNPEMEIALTPDGVAAHTFPVVLKASDTQFYVGTRICPTLSDLRAQWGSFAAGLLSEGVAARQRFYYKWASHFGWAASPPYGWASPEDVVLVHVEPFVENAGEYQAEVVVLADGAVLTADTGDIEHGPGGLITVFKTPGTFTLTPALRAWLRTIVDALATLGYRSAAMDIEFVRARRGPAEYALIEVNSRYSYMGNFLYLSGEYAETSVGHMSLPCNVSAGKPDVAPKPDGAESGTESEAREVRNLLNRTRLALGAAPSTLPSRDHPDTCKLAAFLYTCRDGPIDAFFDRAALARLLGDGTLDAFAPKPVYTRGAVDASDLREYNGWAKVGCVLLTMADDLDAINARLDAVVRTLFLDAPSGYLPLRVVDEDGPGATGLRPDVLDRTKSLLKLNAKRGAPGALVDGEHEPPEDVGRSRSGTSGGAAGTDGSSAPEQEDSGDVRAAASGDEPKAKRAKG